MKVTLVLDVLGGVAVAAKSGERNTYRPLKSAICQSVDPIEVALAYAQLGFTSLYVADLDAIVHGKPDQGLLGDLAATGLDVMADAGVHTREDVTAIEGVTPIIGTETVDSLSVFDELLDEGVGFIPSIDFKDGGLLSQAGLSLEEVLGYIAAKKQIKCVITLDLRAIGTAGGVNLGLCKSVHERLPDRHLIYGGGVSGVPDLKELASAGVSEALVGSALHSGRLTPEDLHGI